MNQESLYLQQGEHKLHLRHIWQNTGGIPVLMFHGAIENGKIFYSHKGKGLACYLAQQGYDVYVLDFRGRGGSLPAIKDVQDHGQHESIVLDIPAAVNFVYERHQQAMHVVCHSWGGVMFSSSLVRTPAIRDKVLSKVCFGTKRQVTVWNLERLFKVSFFWKRVAPLITKKTGFLDAVKLKVGADAETHGTLTQSVAWVKLGNWHDPVDGFDYKSAAERFNWPPTWHIASVKDKVLGHPKDVQLFIAECNNKKAKYTVLSKHAGNQVDYDHINALTHPKAVDDHFPKLALWLKQYEG